MKRMPITSTLDILKDARERRYGVGAYNVLSLDQAAAIIRLSDSLEAPVLVTVPAVLEKYVNFSDLGAITRSVAQKCSIPVGLHLSHGKDIATMQRCIDAGFTSVMIDGSALPFDQNVSLTREAADLCHRHGVACEGELGAVGSATGEVKSTMTDPDEARRYVEQTNIDIFAVSIGNAHGFYKGIPKLDFERFNQIKTALFSKPDVFFTLHGGTGISPQDLKKLIEQGCPKICIYTEMCGAGKEKAFDYLARHPEYGGTTDVPELFKAILDGFLDVVKFDIDVFGSAQKAKCSVVPGININSSMIEDIVKSVINKISK
ncbi:MAG: class II fructose-bisphosphate aldolase family protein [Actinobacteria bacterium]|nr:class II fructose-bisphosphate aldolase family protein [Actinomycetota bacterium]